MRDSRFTFLCDTDERRLLAALSGSLARTQSDVIRCLIREAARELELAPRGSAPNRDATRAGRT